MRERDCLLRTADLAKTIGVQGRVRFRGRESGICLVKGGGGILLRKMGGYAPSKQLELDKV